MSIATSLSALQAVIDPARSHWKVVLDNGKELTENKLVLDLRRGGYRQIDWALDLNSTGDLRHIKQLWLVCPDGQQAMLTIDEPGTAFQFKHTNRDFLGAVGQTLEAQCIGKVYDKSTGDCECWIWDRELGLVHYFSNIGVGDKTFGSWRPNSGLIPPQRLSQDVMGLQLG
jgi:hypothetical protein